METPTATVTLPIGTLRAHAVSLLAKAALERLNYARATQSLAANASIESLPCGEQDALVERIDAMIDRSEGHEAPAATIIAAITAAGYTAPRCVNHELVIVEGAADTIVRMPRYAKEVEQQLREQIVTGRED